VFFEQIIILGYQDQDIIENFQESSAYSLITKLNWMQTTMGDVFWNDKNSISEEIWKSSTLFFDFSLLFQKAPIYQLRFLIDLVLTHILACSDFNGKHHEENKLELAIFIDEAQLLMPNNKSGILSKLEETVTTLRYKGVSVFASGVSRNYMSETLTDTGFVVQFHTRLNSRTNQEILHPYTCYLCCSTTLNTSLIVETCDFKHKQESNKKYLNRLSSGTYSRLEEFSLNFETKWKLKILSTIPKISRIKTPLLNDLQSKASLFLERYWHNKRDPQDTDIQRIVDDTFTMFYQWINHDDRKYLQEFSKEFVLISIILLLHKSIIKNRYNTSGLSLKNSYQRILQRASNIVDEEFISSTYYPSPYS
jgi:hypothetical protein